MGEAGSSCATGADAPTAGAAGESEEAHRVAPGANASIARAHVVARRELHRLDSPSVRRGTKEQVDVRAPALAGEKRRVAALLDQIANDGDAKESQRTEWIAHAGDRYEAPHPPQGAMGRRGRTCFGTVSASAGRSATTTSAPPSKRLINSGRCSG